MIVDDERDVRLGQGQSRRGDENGEGGEARSELPEHRRILSHSQFCIQSSGAASIDRCSRIAIRRQTTGTFSHGEVNSL
jgi:hypothetical protein